MNVAVRSWIGSNFGKLLVGFVTGVVTAVAVAFTSSVVDVVEDWLERIGGDPTEAVVIGQVLRDATPVPGVDVILYDRNPVGPGPAGEPNRGIVDRIFTDSSGYFQFDDIGAGAYNAVAYWNGAWLGRNTFAVADDETAVTARDIVVRSDTIAMTRYDAEKYPSITLEEPQSVEFSMPASTAFLSATPPPGALGAAAPGATPATETASGGDELPLSLAYTASLMPDFLNAELADAGVYTHVVTVSLRGSPEQMEGVRSVEYVLPADVYRPNRVFRFGEQSYEVTFTSWAQFTVHARIYYADGSTEDLDVFVAFGDNTGG